MLKVAGCWDSRMGDVILGCAGCTPTWVSAFNSFLLLLHMFLVTDNPSRQQLSSQPARSLALPAFVSFVFWTSEHISTMLHSAALQAVLTTSSVHLVWQPGALCSSPAVFLTCLLMPCCLVDLQRHRWDYSGRAGSTLSLSEQSHSYGHGWRLAPCCLGG